MVDIKTAPYAALILRLGLGVMFLAHGPYLKVVVYTLPGTADFFAGIGLPAASAYLVVTAESVGGVMLLLGLQARWVALALMPILLGATWVHAGYGWLFTYSGGGWEYPLFLSLAAGVQGLLGNGAYALRLPSVRATAVRGETT